MGSKKFVDDRMLKRQQLQALRGPQTTHLILTYTPTKATSKYHIMKVFTITSTVLAAVVHVSAICPGFNYGIGNQQKLGSGISRCISHRHRSGFAPV
jgi:hypothetical protein